MATLAPSIRIDFSETVVAALLQLASDPSTERDADELRDWQARLVDTMQSIRGARAAKCFQEQSVTEVIHLGNVIVAVN